MKIVYHIEGPFDELLDLVQELTHVTGMQPVELVTESGERFSYSNKDRVRLNKGEITQEQYIKKNSLSS